VELTSSEELLHVIIASRKRLCLFGDDMDAMFENESLDTNFISRLGTWQIANWEVTIWPPYSNDSKEVNVSVLSICPLSSRLSH
jgi:hypothetical protein